MKTMKLLARRLSPSNGGIFKYRCALLIPPNDDEWGKIGERTIYFPDWNGYYDLTGVVTRPRFLVPVEGKGAEWREADPGGAMLSKLRPFEALAPKAAASSRMAAAIDGMRTKREFVIRLLEAYFFDDDFTRYVWT